jgi:preprotein translocase subunit SecA
MLEEDKRLQEETLRQRIIAILEENHIKKEEVIGKETLRNVEKNFMLRALDHNWKEHLAAMDYLRQGIHFRGYAQKDPKQEYKREAFEMFTHLLETIKFEVVGLLFKIPTESTPLAQSADNNQAIADITVDSIILDSNDLAAIASNEAPTLVDQPTSIGHAVSRNDPCPCDSGKKYKHCHGKLA